MSKLSRREFRVLCAFLAAAGLLVIDRFAVSPLALAWHRLDRSIEEKREELTRDRRLIAESGRIKREFASLGIKLGHAGSDQPGEMTDLIREIERLGRKSGLKISDISPQSASGRSAKVQVVSISVESAWEPLMRFLLELERSPRSLQITQAGIHQKGETDAHVIGQFMIGDLLAESPTSS